MNIYNLADGVVGMGLKLKKEHILLILIILAGAFLRLDGLSRALPVQFHPDSWLTVDNAVKFVNFDFNYNRPYAWPAASLIHIYGIMLYIINIFVPVTMLVAVKTMQYGNAIAGILTILFVFLTAKKMHNTKAGLIASLLFSVMMFHVMLSRYETADSWAILLIVVSLYYAWDVADFGSTGGKSNPDHHQDVSYIGFVSDKGRLKVSKEMIILGALIGLGFATKYTNMIVALPILIAMCYKYDFFKKIFVSRKIDNVSLKGFFKSGIVVFVSAAVIFSVIAPHIVFNFQDWLVGLSNEQKNHEGIHGLAPTKGMTIIDKELSTFYFLSYGFGLPLAIFTALALLFALYRREKGDIIISVTALVYCLYMGSFSLRLVRYFVPMYPLFAIMMGSMFGYSLERFRLKWQNAVAYLIIAAIFAYSFAYSMAYVNIMANEDVRVTAGKWMMQNVPPGSSINFGPETNPWMMPVVDYSKYGLSQKPDYIIISKAAYYNVLMLLNSPEIYLPSDWANEMPSQDELAFYNIVYNERGEYKLLNSFTKTPAFMGFTFDETNAPYENWAITHPEIRIYKKMANETNETS